MPAPELLRPGRILRHVLANEFYDLGAYTKAHPGWVWPGKVADDRILNPAAPKTSSAILLAKLPAGAFVRFERLLLDARKVVDAKGARQAMEVTADVGGKLRRGFIYSVYNDKKFVEPAGVEIDVTPGERRELVFKVLKTSLGPVLVEGPRPPPPAQPVQPAAPASPALPAPTGADLIEKLRNYYSQRGYTWDEVNLIGVRRSEMSHDNKYIDLFVVADDTSVVTFRCTTRHGYVDESIYRAYPIAYATDLAPGFYKDTYLIGSHKGPALKQQRTMSGFAPEGLHYQHFKASGWLKETPPENGRVSLPARAGMNIHRRPAGDAKGKDVAVNASSAGCQVIPEWRNIDWMISRLKATEKFKAAGKNGPLWNYLVVHSQDFPLYAEVDAIKKGAP